MEENNKRKLCYRIITYLGILIGIDATSLTDADILAMMKKLENLSHEKLLDIENTLYTIYYD